MIDPVEVDETLQADLTEKTIELLKGERVRNALHSLRRCAS